uniref:Uncharacterized protein n=1 Tax=Cacopsylla melanoneura TaxID=428564 RepID=A0A8D8VGD4_9HEMI
MEREYSRVNLLMPRIVEAHVMNYEYTTENGIWRVLSKAKYRNPKTQIPRTRCRIQCETEQIALDCGHDVIRRDETSKMRKNCTGDFCGSKPRFYGLSIQCIFDANIGRQFSFLPYKIKSVY